MENQSNLDLFSEDQKFIKGMPVRLIYHNEDSAYTVCQIKITETNEPIDDKEIIIIGFFPTIHLNDPYYFQGKIKQHPKYGTQYEVTQYKKFLPQSKDGMVQYLSGDLFPGIGGKTAESIVDTIGEQTITKILENPSLLESVPKLTEEKAKTLYSILLEHQGLEKIMISLADYGFGPQLSMKIYQAYGTMTLDVIGENPYRLIQDIEGIGFHRADEVGKLMGLTGSHPDRIRAGCFYVLNEEALNNGHVYFPLTQTAEAVEKLLSDPELPVSVEEISDEMIRMSEEDQLIIEGEQAYLPSLFFAEKGIVTKIKKLLEDHSYQETFSETEFLQALGRLEEAQSIQYAPSQKEAIHTAIKSSIMLLTGGPGTGKTTVINGIAEVFAELHGLSMNVKDYDEESPFPFLLVAPTGRAAKRMSESTGLPAVTIHRLLGWKGGAGYGHDEENPLEGRLIIIDEMSMVDIWLANQLFKSLPDSIQVVIVGDEDQLPSVGPGQVLKDLLNCGEIPTVRLVDIYRQSEGSSIIDLAHAIKSRHLPEDLMTPREDRRFFSCRQAQIVEAVGQVCNSALRKGFTAKDIQVLAPIYKGNAGIDALNESLQALFNPPSEDKKEILFGHKKFRVGDKVLQLANNPEEQVFNGDIGKIVAMFRAKETTEKEEMLIVDFEGIEVTYLKRDLNQLTLAYCCSIHKSQGSEFPIVVLPVVKGYHRMLRRNLIYTGITRTTSYLIICGDKEAFDQAVHKSDLDDRYSSLKQKLIERLASEGEEAENSDLDDEMPFSPEDEVEIPFPEPEPIEESGS